MIPARVAKTVAHRGRFTTRYQSNSRACSVLFSIRCKFYARPFRGDLRPSQITGSCAQCRR